MLNADAADAADAYVIVRIYGRTDSLWNGLDRNRIGCPLR